MTRIVGGGGYQKFEEWIFSIVRVEVSHLQVIEKIIFIKPPYFPCLVQSNSRDNARFSCDTRVQHCAVRKSDDYRTNCRSVIESR